MASPGNQRRANCISALLFPIALPIVSKHDVIRKTGSSGVQRIAMPPQEDRLQVTYVENLVEFDRIGLCFLGYATCKRTDGQTDRHAHRKLRSMTNNKF